MCVHVVVVRMVIVLVVERCFVTPWCFLLRDEENPDSSLSLPSGTKFFFLVYGIEYLVNKVSLLRQLLTTTQSDEKGPLPLSSDFPRTPVRQDDERY